MGVVRSKYDIDVEEREAVASARRVQREMGEIEKDAKDAQKEVSKARGGGGSLGNRAQGLLDRARKRGILKEEGLELGPLAVGAGGIRGSEEWMKGKRGAVAGPLLAVFVVSTAAHTLASGARGINDSLDWYDTHRETGYAGLAKHASMAAWDGFVDKMGVYALAREGARMFGFSAGNAENVDLALDDLRSNAFGDGKSQVDQIIDQQRTARRQFLENLYAQNASKIREKTKRREAMDEALSKIDQAYAERLSGLKVPQPSNRVPDEIWDSMKWQEKQREKNRRNILKKRIRAAGEGE